MEKFEAPIQESLLQELIELWGTIPELHTNGRMAARVTRS